MPKEDLILGKVARRSHALFQKVCDKSVDGEWAARNLEILASGETPKEPRIQGAEYIKMTSAIDHSEKDPSIVIEFEPLPRHYDLIPDDDTTRQAKALYDALIVRLPTSTFSKLHKMMSEYFKPGY